MLVRRVALRILVTFIFVMVVAGCSGQRSDDIPKQIVEENVVETPLEDQPVIDEANSAAIGEGELEVEPGLDAVEHEPEVHQQEPTLEQEPAAPQQEQAPDQLADYWQSDGPDAKPLNVFTQAERLGRGVNLGNALEGPREGAWGVFLKEEYFQIIHEAGFDTVRVPIKWSNYALAEAPFTIEESFFSRIDWVIKQALDQQLNVVINMHHYDEIYATPLQHEDRFIALWKQIVSRYKDLPDQVYFEILNEPSGDLSWMKWNKLLAKVLKEIRQHDTRHTVIIGGANWNSIGALKQLKIPEDERNVIATFHFYSPFTFTHQGAEWVGKEYRTTGVQWPGPPEQPLEPSGESKQVNWIAQWFTDYNSLPYETNPAGPTPLIKELDMALHWSQANERPLWLGEFGAYGKADMTSRANWTAFVREEAEKRGFSWAYWEFAAGFGVYNKDVNKWNEQLLHALIPDK